MLRYLLILLACTASLLSSAQSPTPAAMAKLEQEMATAVCQDLEKENVKNPVAKFTKEQAMAFLQQSMMKVATSRAAEVQELLQATGKSPEEAMQEVGQRVGQRLISSCPTAITMFAGMAGSSRAIDPAASVVTPAERPLIEAMASDMCTDLERTNAKQPLAKMTKPERNVVLQKLMTTIMQTRAREITAQYGEDIFQDTERVRNLGVKIGIQMVGRCPATVSGLADK
ncbi:hypothetical protein LJY25_10085 [Hymenobacter sp. BT175]|uniref:hypothetical protein n=1 Tax=Hymenobacter translucens TaxID=2886507 RepID=UPI001D0F2715|nr:hypothetical protein [Hymenobacter translucens]MCC2546792.1 hypothetical protein [Hymenobacter translucens]